MNRQTRTFVVLAVALVAASVASYGVYRAIASIPVRNIEIATVDKLGLVTAVRRGEAAVMVRYEGAYTATTLISMG